MTATGFAKSAAPAFCRKPEQRSNPHKLLQHEGAVLQFANRVKSPLRLTPALKVFVSASPHGRLRTPDQLRVAAPCHSVVNAFLHGSPARGGNEETGKLNSCNRYAIPALILIRR